MSTEKKYCVYCHTCNEMQYIGVTCNVKNRWGPSRYKNTSLAPYIDKYGWDAIKHEILYSNLTRDEALKLEDQLIVKARENGTCINKIRSGHYRQTDEFKDAEKVRAKVYREEHPEECKARNKAWQKAHPEEYKAYQKVSGKAWREANPDYMREYCREWRKRKKEQNKKSPPPIF